MELVLKKEHAKAQMWLGLYFITIEQEGKIWKKGVHTLAMTKLFLVEDSPSFHGSGTSLSWSQNSKKPNQKWNGYWKNKKQKRMWISDGTQNDLVAEMIEVQIEQVDATLNPGPQILDFCDYRRMIETCSNSNPLNFHFLCKHIDFFSSILKTMGMLCRESIGVLDYSPAFALK